MLRAIGVITILCMLSACESVFEIEAPSGEHKIVAYSFFTPDSVWTATIDISLRPDPSSPVELLPPQDGVSFLSGVVVIADDQGNVDTLRQVSSDMYRSVHDLRPRPGITYTLRAELPDAISRKTLSPLLPVEASAQLPERVSMQNVAYSNDDGTSSLRFTIEDPTGANYYRLELYQVGPDNGGVIIDNSLFIPQAVEDVFNYRRVPFQSTDPSLRFHYGQVDNLHQSEDLNFDFFGHAVFSDALFDGMSHDMEIAFEPYTYEGFEPRFTVILSTLSSDFFMYHYTRDRHLSDEATGNSSSTVFETFPVSVYTNIKNGYGVFAGYVSDTYRFDLDGNEWQE